MKKPFSYKFRITGFLIFIIFAYSDTGYSYQHAVNIRGQQLSEQTASAAAGINPLPFDVKVETVGVTEVVLRPDLVTEAHILNPAGMPLNGWRVLFPRRAIEGIVSPEHPGLLRSEIGCYIHDPDAEDSQKKIIIDISMLKPDDPSLAPAGENVNDIVALEDARSIEHDGIIYLVLNVVKKDGSVYLAVTTHDTQEFINKVKVRINDPEAALHWNWTRLERLVKDGPYANDNVKSAVMVGAPSSDGTFSILYRPTSKKGEDGRPEIDLRRFIMRLTSKNLNGPWFDAGIYMEEKRPGCWIGPSAYISGPPESIAGYQLEFMVFHTGAGDDLTGFRYYHQGLIIADRNNLDNKIIVDPILVPDETDREEGWVDNVIYSDMSFFITPDKEVTPGVFELYFDIYFAEKDKLVKRVTKRITLTLRTAAKSNAIGNFTILKPAEPFLANSYARECL